MLYICFDASTFLHGFQYPIVIFSRSVRIVAEPDGMARDHDQMVELCIARVPLERRLYAQWDRRLELLWTCRVVPSRAGCVRVRAAERIPRRVRWKEDKVEVEQERARECQHKQGCSEVGEPCARPECRKDLLRGREVVVGGVGCEVWAGTGLAARSWEWEHHRRSLLGCVRWK